MRVRIHRGTKEVGGNCIELSSGGKTLLLDMGMPLTAPDPANVKLPQIEGLQVEDRNFLGIVVSHPHFDHYGLIQKARSSTRVFIGSDAEKILRAAIPFGSFGVVFQNVTHYQHRVCFEVGPFKITPFLNDHSAFDAYSFLVEADGQSLFYSADLRGHGRKARLFDQFLKTAPKPVDVLLMEGTTIGRENGKEVAKSEAELEREIFESLKVTPGLALAYFSAQNIDRFVTFFKASKRAGRTFVADLYLAHILDALGRKSLPSPRGNDLRVFLPSAMKRRIVREKSFDLVAPYYPKRIYPEEIARCASDLMMIFRPSMAADLENALRGAKLFYSLWPGYLERDGFDLQAWCVTRKVAFEIHHTSGHAGISDLKRLVKALEPKRLVPIHSFAPQRFRSFFPNVQPANDGEWWEV
ncbi:MAG: MBL fold metallo-hydrolase [Candidatus Binatus sp.]|uniref:MBL fold metallo-hydrolase n=1 Tax=Candidatus Binatus sp. TaxID=2811406 RepID=UPI00271ED195|nr:MBL fold metallo-hydrolase [Candidatus Binatus sp.]MDO8431848.1 MBL fold metallo-hydrolase [Candidatus Binatus sp.]